MSLMRSTLRGCVRGAVGCGWRSRGRASRGVGTSLCCASASCPSRITSTRRGRTSVPAARAGFTCSLISLFSAPGCAGARLASTTAGSDGFGCTPVGASSVGAGSAARSCSFACSCASLACVATCTVAVGAGVGVAFTGATTAAGRFVVGCVVDVRADGRWYKYRPKRLTAPPKSAESRSSGQTRRRARLAASGTTGCAICVSAASKRGVMSVVSGSFGSDKNVCSASVMSLFKN